MALYNEDIVDIELLSGNFHRSFVNRSIGEGDKLANRFGVHVMKNGEDEDLSGASCTGYFIRSDMETVVIVGSISGSIAYVDLPQACYVSEGQFSLAIKVTIGERTGTMRIVDGVVVNTTTGTMVDPGTIIPSVEDLIEAINDAVESIPSDYSVLDNNVKDFNAYGILPDLSRLPLSDNGLTITYAGNGFLHLSGTPEGRHIYNVFTITDIPQAFKGLKNAIVGIQYKNRNTDYKIPFDVYVETVSDPSLHILVNDITETTYVNIPSDVTKILLRIDIPAEVTTTFNDDVMASVFAGRMPNSNILDRQIQHSEMTGLTEPDLNKVTGNRDCLLVSSVSYINKPADATANTGFLTVRKISNYSYQLLYEFTGSRVWKRRDYGNNGETWEGWMQISGEGGGGTTIENTYNINTSPVITTDTNGWLQAVDTESSSETGKTDMTGAIMSMLNDTGYCHLGEGIFYVSGNIDMPANSTLCGCGDKTQVRLLQSVTTGYCVKLTDYSTIKDVSFSGSYSTISPSTQGTRDGIHFVGGYESTPQKRCSHCVIDNVIIRNFSGSGILCDETSISPEHGLYATNIYISNCYAGININRYSEFHKFTNICTTNCYYGVINNGGNNVFTACTFRANDTGFYINGDAPNNAHGTINGCTFCHIGGNQGSAIRITNVTAGFVIANCQFWYNSIDLTGSEGIVFTGCEFGRGISGAGATINILGGKTIMFAGCVFMNDVGYPPEIYISNNNKVKFNGCYGSVSGNEITAS